MSDSKMLKQFDNYPQINYTKGAIIIRGDEPLNNGWYLIKGLVRQYSLTSSGETLVTHVFKPGSCFPMTWIFNQTPNVFFYDAITPATLKRIPREVILQFIKDNPDELYEITKRLLLGISGLQARMLSLVLSSAYAKTAGLLAYMALSFGEEGAKGTYSLPFNIPHREIASWIGTTRETASLQIEALKRRGVIKTKGRKLLIVDLTTLSQIATDKS